MLCIKHALAHSAGTRTQPLARNLRIESGLHSDCTSNSMMATEAQPLLMETRGSDPRLVQMRAAGRVIG